MLHRGYLLHLRPDAQDGGYQEGARPARGARVRHHHYPFRHAHVGLRPGADPVRARGVPVRPRALRLRADDVDFGGDAGDVRPG